MCKAILLVHLINSLDENNNICNNNINNNNNKTKI